MKEWTLESYNKLCEEYKTGASWETISSRVGYNKKACMNKFNRGASKNNKWTTQEIELLTWCCTICKEKKIKWDIVSNTVKRTPNACRLKWQSLKIL
jgi:hypothetical protein